MLDIISHGLVGKKKKLSIIVLMSNSSCLKIVQNPLGVLYTLIHSVHFPYTISVILYSGANFIHLLNYVSIIQSLGDKENK